MKAEKYCFILVVFAGILCVPVLGKVELLLPEDEPILIGQPNPTLAGIDKLYVWIVPHGFELNSHGLVFEELENLITDRLKEASITIAETDIDKMGPDDAKMLKVLKRRIELANVKNLKFKPARIPELRIGMDTLVLEHLKQAVFHIQISLARLVRLEKENRPVFKTDVWQSEPIMQAVSVESMPAAVTSAVLEQVEAFVHAYLAAKPPNKQPTDANNISIVPKEQAKPVTKSTPAKYEYVASKNSQVFHKPGCRWAENISENNLVGYDSREEAIKAGKRPCKWCKP